MRRSVCRSVCPAEFLVSLAKKKKLLVSDRMGKSSAPTGRIFDKFWYLSIFQNSVAKIEVSLEADRYTGTLHEDVYTFMTVSCSVLRS